jgi:hypothetical protein
MASTPSAAHNVTPVVRQNTCNSISGRIAKDGPFYLRIRPFALISKGLGTFPLQNICTKDGRELKHRWVSAVFFYDFMLFMIVGITFIYTSVNLIQVPFFGNIKQLNDIFFNFSEAAKILFNVKDIHDKEDKYQLVIWLRFTLYAAGSRNFIQFIFCHFYAHKYPQLFAALEHYFQGIGAGVMESRVKVIIQQSVPIMRTVGFLIFLAGSTYSFFHQFPVIKN